MTMTTATTSVTELLTRLSLDLCYNACAASIYDKLTSNTKNQDFDATFARLCKVLSPSQVPTFSNLKKHDTNTQAVPVQHSHVRT